MLVLLFLSLPISQRIERFSFVRVLDAPDPDGWMDVIIGDVDEVDEPGCPRMAVRDFAPHQLLGTPRAHTSPRDQMSIRHQNLFNPDQGGDHLTQIVVPCLYTLDNEIT